MAKTREIRQRIKAVGNIQRITKTMQMIATARFQASQRRATAARPYTRKIAELVGELAGAAASAGAGLSHPLLRAPEPKLGRELLLVITASRGLCGGYNGNILRTANDYRAQRGDQGLDIEVVGKKGVAFFKFNRVPLAQVHTQFGDKPAYEEVERLAERYMADFAAGRFDAVRVVYMAFESMSRQRPRVLQLLPMEDPTKAVGGTDGTSGGAAGSLPASGADRQGTGSKLPVAPGTQDYDFSPDPQTLLAELLPVTVKTQLFQCFNEAVVSEQIARMVAMKAATDNAGQMKKDLSRLYNRARQTAITTELSEIIGGAAALQ